MKIHFLTSLHPAGVADPPSSMAKSARRSAQDQPSELWTEERPLRGSGLALETRV